MSLEYEPSSEPLHTSANYLFLNASQNILHKSTAPPARPLSQIEVVGRSGSVQVYSGNPQGSSIPTVEREPERKRGGERERESERERARRIHELNLEAHAHNDSGSAGAGRRLKVLGS